MDKLGRLHCNAETMRHYCKEGGTSRNPEDHGNRYGPVESANENLSQTGDVDQGGNKKDENS
jgi:hypothetical protein